MLVAISVRLTSAGVKVGIALTRDGRGYIVCQARRSCACREAEVTFARPGEWIGNQIGNHKDIHKSYIEDQKLDRLGSVAWSAEPADTSANSSAHCQHHNARECTVVGSCLRSNDTMPVWGVQTALEAVGTGGTVVQVGLGQDNCCAPTQQTVFKEINFTGSWLYTNTVSNLQGSFGHMVH